MMALFAAFGVGLATCLILTPVVRALALGFGLVDRPDNHRKIHGKTIPLGGGIALLIAVAVGVAAFLVVRALSGLETLLTPPPLLGLLLGGILVCVVGIVDDYGYLRGRHKLLGQLVAISIVVVSGLQVRSVSLLGVVVDLGPVSFPFTALWLLCCVNSLNLMDGMDGLLSGITAIVVLAAAVLAAWHGQLVTAAVALALAGAVLGFLRYNFPPASIFMGDAGSMLIGLLVGALTLQCSLGTDHTAKGILPAILLTVPLLDTTAAVLRRKLTGRSIYTTDRGHIHHLLLRRGLSTRSVLLLICAFCLWAVLAGLASAMLRNDLLGVLPCGVLIFGLVATGLFGQGEYHLVQSLVARKARGFIRGRDGSRAEHVEVRLQGSLDWTELWAEIIQQAHGLNLNTVKLDVNAPALHEGYHACWQCNGATESPNEWMATLPVVVDGQLLGRLEVTGSPDTDPLPKVASVTHLLSHLQIAGRKIRKDGPHRENGSPLVPAPVEALT